MEAVWGVFMMFFGYGLLMGVWWNLNEVLKVRGVSQNVVRLVSGLMSGIVLISMSFGFFGNPGIPASKVLLSFLGAIVLNIVIAYAFVGAVFSKSSAIGAHAQVLGPVMALFVGRLLLGEFPNIIAFSGILVLLAGVYLLHKDESDTTISGPFVTIWKERNEWLKYVVIIGLASGFAVPLDKMNVLATNGLMGPGITQFFGWGVFYLFRYLISSEKTELNKKTAWYLLVWGQCLAVVNRVSYLFRYLISSEKTELNKKTAWYLLALGLCFALANGIQGVAYTVLDTAVMVTSIKRADALWAVLLCYTLFSKYNKGKKKVRLSGAVVVFVGMIIMGLSQIL